LFTPVKKKEVSATVLLKPGKDLQDQAVAIAMNKAGKSKKPKQTNDQPVLNSKKPWKRL